MSREVDKSKPLSEAEYLYLRDRDALPEEYKLKKEVKERPDGARKARPGPAADTTTGDPATAPSSRFDVLSIDELRGELEARGENWDVNEQREDLVGRLAKVAHSEDDDEEVF